MNIVKRTKLLFVFILFIATSIGYSQSDVFKVVLDAGHGGKDKGACYHGKKEKDITLAVTLKVGKIIEENSNIDLIYTRKTDEFIELRERAKIANRGNANLFVSIHCNANTNPNANGSETYVMGMSRANMNFEVSKAENSVIFLEDNYKASYKGFDPNNPETMIGLKIVQENNLDSSIDLATKVQNNFSIINAIKSRGVKQEPLWVLDASIMPGVLIEIGFISNPTEVNILDSEEGQNDIAKAIADAIISYKKEYFGNGSSDIEVERPSQKIIEKPIKETPIEVKKTVESQVIKKESSIQEESKGIIFKVQLSASAKKVALEPKNFKGLKNITISQTSSLYKYMYGETANYDEAKKLLQEAKSKGYKSAYLIAFKDGKSITVQDAIK